MIESGAILVYLAEKAGRLLPTEPRARAQVFQWVFFNSASIGPSQGAADVLQYEVPVPVMDAVQFFLKRTLGLYAVFDRQLADREWLAGDFSIADIANWTYIGTAEWVGIDLAPYPNLVRWLGSMARRPGCRRGLNVPIPLDPDNMPVGFEDLIGLEPGVGRHDIRKMKPAIAQARQSIGGTDLLRRSSTRPQRPDSRRPRVIRSNATSSCHNGEFAPTPSNASGEGCESIGMRWAGRRPSPRPAAWGSGGARERAALRGPRSGGRECGCEP